MAAAAVRASPAPQKDARSTKARSKQEPASVKKAAPKKEIVSDDGETVYRPDDDEATDGQSPTSPEFDEDTARVRVYDDGEVIYRATGSETESDEADSGELSPHRKAETRSAYVDPDADTIVRRPVEDDDPEVVRIPSPDHDPEVVIRRDVSDDPEVVIRHDVSDDPEVVIHNDVSDDPEVVIRHDVSDDPEVVIRHDVSDDPEVVIRAAPDDDPEVVVRHDASDDPEVVINDDPEVVRLAPSAALKVSDRSSDSEATNMRISPRRSRKEKQRSKPELVTLCVQFNNCDSAVAESLWLRVLSYLPPRDLCAAALVSKEMKRLADEDELWQPIVHKQMGYAAKPESRTWKEVFGMRNKYAFSLPPSVPNAHNSRLGLWRRTAPALVARTLPLWMVG